VAEDRLTPDELEAGSVGDHDRHDDPALSDEQLDGPALSDEELDADEPPDDAEIRDSEFDDEEETDFATVATGPDVTSAKRTALEQLRKIVPWVTEADVDFEVVDEGSRGGLFGRGRVQSQVEARVRPRDRDEEEPPAVEAPSSELVDELSSFLGDVVDLMGLEADIDVHEDDEGLVADLGGPDLGILIGRHGQTIDALQYISAIAVNRRHKSRRRVIVDAEGYRDRRATSLHSMADRVAQQVVRDREPVTLKPMTAAERKVIHLYLKDHPRVETVSEGQEPNRAVTIALRPL
jgi:spoIIIJ-associated protein